MPEVVFQWMKMCKMQEETIIRNECVDYAWNFFAKTYYKVSHFSIGNCRVGINGARKIKVHVYQI